MADEHQNDYMDEEEGFKTPQASEKKKKMKKKKKTTSETENHDEGETMEINVKEISEKPDRVPPIVAYFASGYDPCAQSGERESPTVTVYRNKLESKKRLQVVVSPPGKSVEFVGSNYTGEQAARQTCVYKLGVLDKETQTLRILPIAHNKIFRLEPRVKTKETADSEASEITVLPGRRERLAELDHEFGTKKAINQEKKRRARNLGNDPDAQKSDEDKLDKVDVNQSALESTASMVARNIPPHDASATNPREAYPIEKIIESGEWVFLQDIYKLLGQEPRAPTDAYPVFVRNRLYRLDDIKDDAEKQSVCGVLSFLTHLVKFKDMNSMDGFDSAKNHKFPPIVRQKCKTLFKDSDSTRIPVDKINLLISYVLVLTLHVDKFKTDPEDIAKDLRMSSFDLRKHFENLGCKFSREKSTFLATLPVPLKFQQITRRRKR
ncbi:hypothetical protein EUTSA_v10020760mg [Eutrema salsugineum]|uniref:DNA-directed RNA polymerase I subunit rpa49 n=1 Tax=Eutrema salsugineum TaxID=72664 RepID=V4LDT3_EUTSA|nr:DNA-directed RNA polymerase I subunit rpa49 [Eutrema salsugineum]ESQ48600.1 hypothetical protein EUTSA_v10020760mg [Eutrema salsugineum]